MIWWIVGGILAVYVVAMLVIAWTSLHPFRIPFFLSPGALDTPQEEVSFTSADGTNLRGWWIEQPEPDVVAIFAHGYVMNRSELAPVAFTLWNKGCACLLFDFRCHGRSGGKKSGLGLAERLDVRAAVDYARSRAPGAKIVLIGSSMGSAAIALASVETPGLADALVIDSAYGRLSSAVIGWWRFLGGNILAAILSPTTVISMPMAGFNPFKVDVAQALAELRDVPVLFLHGEMDTLALPAEAKRNYEACGSPKEIVWFPKCGHSEGRWIHPHLYNGSLLGFLEKHNILSRDLERV